MLSDLDPRRNSLNALRLLFASLVIVSHAWPIGGFGADPHLGHVSLGHLAVYGFFAISGYLIVASRQHSRSGGRYLWHRVLRIFPGYWTCLVVMAAVFAPIAALTGGSYTAVGGVRFVVDNAALVQRTGGIPGTLAHVAFGPVWNGSLWTLAYEFCCYLLVALLATFGLLRRSVLAATVLALSGLLLVTHQSQYAALHLSDIRAYDLMVFTLVFAAGGLLYLCRDRVPLTWPLAGLAAAVFTLGVAGPLNADAVIAVPAAYLCLFVGSARTGWFRRNDVSYGVYVYAFPVQQLLALWGGTRWGVTVYVLLTVPIVVLLAALSWVLVERPALRLKDARLPWRQRELPVAVDVHVVAAVPLVESRT